MATKVRIALGQINCCVGDIAGNTLKIIQFARKAHDEQRADLVIFPELALTGYPPEDLLLRDGLINQVEQALLQLQQQLAGTDVIVGYPRKHEGKLYNSACLISAGRIECVYDKQKLPNYAVFDERRYFEAGSSVQTFERSGTCFALSICEDIWFEDTVVQAKQAGAQVILSLNASPYHYDKIDDRKAVVKRRIDESGIAVVYVNLVGGQDELVFDGGSFVMDHQGDIKLHLQEFVEEISVIEFTRQPDMPAISQEQVSPRLEFLESVLQALVLGVRDYVNKSGFSQVVLGLSGGIDSALTLYIAVQALGAENVETIMLPSRFTADISSTDAEKLAKTLGVAYKVIPIESVFNAFTQLLADEFSGYDRDTTEENMQARCRGLILMAISNKKHKMVLTTGNKSEMAVGYSTLYGDMAGGFDVLKDVPKILVYRLSEYINRDYEVIPERIITRPPSAELSENQTDQDSLPAYEILDEILERYVERDESMQDIIAAGFDRDTVQRVVHLVDLNEYKRRQAPPGVRITRRAFGKDRRYPIVSRFRDH